MGQLPVPAAAPGKPCMSAMTELEICGAQERLSRIEDRLELLELPALYSRAIDDQQIDDLLDCFCVDGIFERANGSRSTVGHAALGAFYAETLREYGVSQHIPHAQVIEQLRGDEAAGWVLAHAELAVGDQYVVAAIRYEDDYRRVGGRWRFARRSINFWYMTDWNHLGETVIADDRVRFRSHGPADLPHRTASYQRFVGGETRNPAP